MSEALIRMELERLGASVEDIEEAVAAFAADEAMERASSRFPASRVADVETV